MSTPSPPPHTPSPDSAEHHSKITSDSNVIHRSRSPKNSSKIKAKLGLFFRRRTMENQHQATIDDMAAVPQPNLEVIAPVRRKSSDISGSVRRKFKKTATGELYNTADLHKLRHASSKSKNPQDQNNPSTDEYENQDESDSQLPDMRATDLITRKILSRIKGFPDNNPNRKYKATGSFQVLFLDHNKVNFEKQDVEIPAFGHYDPLLEYSLQNSCDNKAKTQLQPPSSKKLLTCPQNTPLILDSDRCRVFLFSDVLLFTQKVREKQSKHASSVANPTPNSLSYITLFVAKFPYYSVTAIHNMARFGSSSFLVAPQIPIDIPTATVRTPRSKNSNNKLTKSSSSNVSLKAVEQQLQRKKLANMNTDSSKSASSSTESMSRSSIDSSNSNSNAKSPKFRKPRSNSNISNKSSEDNHKISNISLETSDAFKNTDQQPDVPALKLECLNDNASNTAFDPAAGASSDSISAVGSGESIPDLLTVSGPHVVVIAPDINSKMEWSTMIQTLSSDLRIAYTNLLSSVPNLDVHSLANQFQETTLLLEAEAEAEALSLSPQTASWITPDRLFEFLIPVTIHMPIWVHSTFVKDILLTFPYIYSTKEFVSKIIAYLKAVSREQLAIAINHFLDILKKWYILHPIDLFSPDREPYSLISSFIQFDLPNIHPNLPSDLVSSTLEQLSKESDAFVESHPELFHQHDDEIPDLGKLRQSSVFEAFTDSEFDDIFTSSTLVPEISLEDGDDPLQSEIESETTESSGSLSRSASIQTAGLFHQMENEDNAYLTAKDGHRNRNRNTHLNQHQYNNRTPEESENDDESTVSASLSSPKFNKSKSVIMYDDNLEQDTYVNLATMLNEDPLEFAKAMSIIDFQYFALISPREMIKTRWQKQKDKAVNLTASIHRFNMLVNWVVTQVLLSKSFSTRVQVLKFLIQIAKSCRDINNYNGVMAIISGLETADIIRLYYTWQVIREQHPETYQQFEELRDLVCEDARWKTLKVAILTLRPDVGKRSGLRSLVDTNSLEDSFPMLDAGDRQSCLPFVGILLSDIVAAESAGPTLQDGLINWAKLRSIAALIFDILKFQTISFHFSKDQNADMFSNSYDSASSFDPFDGIDPKFVDIFKPKVLKTMSPDMFYTHSLKCEPRSAKTFPNLIEFLSPEFLQSMERRLHKFINFLTFFHLEGLETLPQYASVDKGKFKPKSAKLSQKHRNMSTLRLGVRPQFKFHPIILVRFSKEVFIFSKPKNFQLSQSHKFPLNLMRVKYVDPFAIADKIPETVKSEIFPGAAAHFQNSIKLLMDEVSRRNQLPPSDSPQFDPDDNTKQINKYKSEKTILTGYQLFSKGVNMVIFSYQRAAADKLFTDIRFV